MPPELLRLLNAGDYGEVVNQLRNGRLASTPDTARNAAQYDPKLHEINDPVKRPDKMVVIDKDSEEYGEVKNINPNVEMTTETGFRVEKVARIALAIQKLIVKRAVAFTFGNPPAYTSDAEDPQEQKILQAIKRIFNDVKEGSLNRKIARSVFRSQEVAELWYPVMQKKEHQTYGFPTKYKFKVAIFSPALGDKLWPYFDDNRDLVAFSREFTRKDGDLITRNYFETYTADAHYLWTADGEGAADANNWEMADGYPKKLTIGKIPIVYANQEQTEWADVQSLIDRLEKLLSNFADTNDYHASPKIFVEGTIKGFARKGEAGAIIEGEEGAKAQYLSWANAPESVKLEIETLLRLIYTITQTPDISFDTVKGIGAVSGVALRLLFMDAHLKVQDKCEIFDEYLQRRCNIVKAYIGQAWQQAEAAAESLIVKPQIIPYIIEDELSKINILQAANGGKQIASRKETIRRLGWADDADAEEEAIQAEEDRESSYELGEPTLTSF